MEATIAVVNESIEKPGTTLLDIQRRKTFIKKAASPKVRTVKGRAISWRMGRIKVLTIPITTAVTIAAEIPDIRKPGTKYSTIRSAKTLIASLMTNLILDSFYRL